MKKLLLLIASTGFLFSSCQKDESMSPTFDLQSPTSRISAPNSAAVSPLPSKFLKKILVEEYVGTSYPLVPEANYDLQQLVSTNRDRVFSVGMHFNDPLATTQTSKMLAALGNTSPTIPSGTVDRQVVNGLLFTDSKTFPNAIARSLSRSQNCGIAISSNVLKRKININIYCGFLATMPGNYNITAYLVEDKIINTPFNLQQTNGFDQTFGSHFFHLGNPIPYYAQYNVISKVLTNSTGDAINPNANIAGGTYIHPIIVDVPKKLDPNSKFKIIAFLTNTSTNEIVNVQEAELGILKDWN